MHDISVPYQLSDDLERELKSQCNESSDRTYQMYCDVN